MISFVWFRIAATLALFLLLCRSNGAADPPDPVVAGKRPELHVGGGVGRRLAGVRVQAEQVASSIPREAGPNRVCLCSSSDANQYSSGHAGVNKSLNKLV